mgnify:CR=1 FL=1
MNNKKETISRLKKLCSKKEKCIKDIKKKLEEWNINDSDISEIVEILIKENYINEERYVKAYINDKVKFEKWGKNKIIYELRKKGIDENLIHKIINSYDNEEYYKNLKEIIEKKRKILKDDSYENRRKLIRYLYSKGYSIDDINKFIDIDDLSD